MNQFIDRDISWALSQCKDCLSRYRDFHHEDKMVVRPSYLYNGNPYNGKHHLYIETASWCHCVNLEVLHIFYVYDFINLFLVCDGEVNVTSPCLQYIAWHRHDSSGSWVLKTDHAKRRFREFVTLQERLEEQGIYRRSLRG